MYNVGKEHPLRALSIDQHVCPCAFFGINHQKITQHMVSMPYPSVFFALMTHKSVTCAMVPSKSGVPLTGKNRLHVYIFLEKGSVTFLFSRTRVFYAVRLRCVFPPPKFQISHRNFHQARDFRIYSSNHIPTHQIPQTATAATIASTTSMFCLDPGR